ncbi:MAG: hypothetical protein M1511_13820 [Deltaproteobacteria bacterium]|nr:hypothetical protein [Deltaproteobacteria bacterium]
MPSNLRFILKIVSLGIGSVLAQSCFGPSGMSDIKYNPLALVSDSRNVAEFSDAANNVSIEVKKVQVSKPVENLAIHYPSLFPDGETIRTGDREEYAHVGNKTAYKVVFQTKYIRKRKRLQTKNGKLIGDVPEGWTESKFEDPVTGKKIPIIIGPVIPEKKILYVVPGSENVYYVLLKVDGQGNDNPVKNFEKFVREGINYD